jgi:hypothetical protein
MNLCEKILPRASASSDIQDGRAADDEQGGGIRETSLCVVLRTSLASELPPHQLPTPSFPGSPLLHLRTLRLCLCYL